MAKKKNVRADGTYMISTDSTDNPKLGAKQLSNGRESLFLDYYLGFESTISKTGREYKRPNKRRESLKLYLWQAPRTPHEVQENKETIELAKRIRFERGQQLLEQQEGYRLQKDKKINFLDWYDGFLASYNKTDKNKIRRAKELFIECMASTPGLTQYAKKIIPAQLTKEVITVFVEFLQQRFNGETPHTLYSRFKKVILAAVDRDVLKKNPCKGVSIKIDRNRIPKEILSQEEMMKLISTHYMNERPAIRRAFIFCLYCGLRFCDVKDLTYSNVDRSNKLLQFEQSKTKGHSAYSSVILPLNDVLLQLIGAGEPSEKIFSLPSDTTCRKHVDRWTKAAGISKHITWHCARHSCATNLLTNGANPMVVKTILGHSDLRMTEKYLRAIDQEKQNAINSLPALPSGALSTVEDDNPNLDSGANGDCSEADT